MTKEDVKKRLECAARITGNDLFVDAYKIITEQEKSIQMAQDSILSLAQQNQEYREQQVKQAQIDILNELKPLLEGYIHKTTGESLYVYTCKMFNIEVQNAEDKD